MKLSIKILIHAIFWIVFESINTYDAIRMYNEGFMFSKPTHILLNTLWAALAFYLFYVYFIRYLERGNYLKYLLTSVLTSITITFIFIPVHKVFYEEFQVFNPDIFGPPLVGTFLIIQCGSLIRGFENWVDNIKEKAELETRNAKNELELLKSQINPHFLFNTLNNIDALIYKSPDDASHSLLTLSEMLRYMIYETNVEYVPLTKEIEYLQHYISLQKLRLRQPDMVSVELPDKCNVSIAPMLLLPFVENAFKYSSNKESNFGIDIKLTCDYDEMHFTCLNSFTNKNSIKIHSGGVGLENVKRRLELIYPNKHTLSISIEDGIFKVVLIIKCV